MTDRVRPAERRHLGRKLRPVVQLWGLRRGRRYDLVLIGWHYGRTRRRLGAGVLPFPGLDAAPRRSKGVSESAGPAGPHWGAVALTAHVAEQKGGWDQMGASARSVRCRWRQDRPQLEAGAARQPHRWRWRS